MSFYANFLYLEPLLRAKLSHWLSFDRSFFPADGVFFFFSLILAKYAMRVARQNREAKMDNRVIRRYQCVEKLPSVIVVNRRYFVRNFPDKDFLPITRGAFYQRLSMVNSIKIRRTEMTASVRVRTTRRTGGP